MEDELLLDWRERVHNRLFLSIQKLPYIGAKGQIIFSRLNRRILQTWTKQKRGAGSTGCQPVAPGNLPGATGEASFIQAGSWSSRGFASVPAGW
jgi:hypothetical protein